MLTVQQRVEDKVKVLEIDSGHVTRLICWICSVWGIVLMHILNITNLNRSKATSTGFPRSVGLPPHLCIWAELRNAAETEEDYLCQLLSDQMENS